MKTSILIYATCFIVTGCSAQLRFPSLSSALSSLTGFGSGSSSSSSSSNSGSQSGQSSSPYSGLVRDYGRNLMMAMSNIYPTLFKPPQSQQQQQSSQPASQSPYDQAFGASQFGQQGLFSSQSAPSFTFGGSTFSISPSLPFGSLSGASSQPQPSSSAQPGSHSPFSASFGSSINSPSSFGPLSSSQFLQNSMPSFAPASSYNAAFEAANGGPSSFGSLNSSPGLSQAGSSSSSSLNNQAALLSQPSNSQSINSFSQMPGFSSQHEPVVGSQQVHQPQQPTLGQTQNIAAASHSTGQYINQHGAQPGNQFASQQYRPDMMSIAASAPVPSSNSYSPPANYGSIHGAPQGQQAPVSPSAYQQPSYR